jgi:hypothetical protein
MLKITNCERVNRASGIPGSFFMTVSQAYQAVSVLGDVDMEALRPKIAEGVRLRFQDTTHLSRPLVAIQCVCESCPTDALNCRLCAGSQRSEEGSGAVQFTVYDQLRFPYRPFEPAAAGTDLAQQALVTYQTRVRDDAVLDGVVRAAETLYVYWKLETSTRCADTDDGFKVLVNMALTVHISPHVL